MSSRALKMLGEGLAAEIELYECFWGNFGIYPPTQINGTLIFTTIILLYTQHVCMHFYPIRNSKYFKIINA